MIKGRPDHSKFTFLVIVALTALGLSGCDGRREIQRHFFDLEKELAIRLDSRDAILDSDDEDEIIAPYLNSSLFETSSSSIGTAAEGPDVGDPNGAGPQGAPVPGGYLEDLRRAADLLAKELEQLSTEDPEYQKKKTALQWKIAAIEAGILKFAEAEETLLARRSAEAFRQQALIIWTQRVLNDLAEVLDLDLKGDPLNEYRFIPKTQLERRHASCSKYLELLNALTARFPGALFLKAEIRTTEARLVRILDALQVPYSSPSDLLKGASLNSEKLEKAEVLIAQATRSKAKQILKITISLLEQAAIIDPTHIGVVDLLSELSERQSLVPLFRKPFPSWMSFTTYFGRSLDGVGALYKKRFQDPLEAVAYEAALRDLWNREFDQLPKRLQESFARWLAASLNNRDLSFFAVRLNLRLSELENALDGIQEKAYRQSVGFDKSTAKEELAAIEAEIDHRIRGGSHWRPAVKRRWLKHSKDLIHAILTRKPEKAFDVLEKHSPQSLYEALARHIALVPTAGEQARHRKERLALKGFGASVSRLKHTADHFQESRRDIEAAAERHGSVIEGSEPWIVKQKAAQELIAQQVDHLLRGLSSAQISAAEAEASLRRRLLQIRAATAEPSDPAPATYKLTSRLVPPVPGAEPFGDAIFETNQQRLAELISPWQLAKRLERKLEDQKPFVDQKARVAFDKDPKLNISKQEGSRRPDLPGWRVDGQTVAFERIHQLESLRELPGGIAIGHRAQVPGDWSTWTLTYLQSERRPAFVRIVLSEAGEPTHQRILLPKVDLPSFKTAWLFAADKDQDPVAVSVGVAGGQTASDFSIDQEVLLHPILRDTRFGLDALQTDRLPWRLFEAELPNGFPNPYRSIMAPLLPDIRKAARRDLQIDELNQRIMSALQLKDKITLNSAQRHEHFQAVLRELKRSSETWKKIASWIAEADDWTPPFLESATLTERRYLYILSKNRARISELRSSFRNKTYLDDEVFLAYSTLPKNTKWAVFELLVGSQTGEPSLSLEDLILMVRCVLAASADREIVTAEIVEYVIRRIHGKQVSVLTNEPASFVLKNDRLVAERVDLVVRYVHGKIELQGTKMLKLDKPVLSGEADRLATQIVAKINQKHLIFSNLERLRKDCLWVGFWRWALDAENKTLGHIDRFSLLTVDHRSHETPDYLLRGNG